MAKHHAGSSAVLSSGPAVQLRPHNFVVTCIASPKHFALVTKLFRVFGGGSSLESHHSCLTFGGKKSVVDVIIPYAM